MQKPIDPIKGIRNLAVVSGLTGLAIFTFARLLSPSPEAIGLASLVWLAAPVLYAGFYLTRGKSWRYAGLSPPTKGSALWFVFAIALVPALAGILLLINQVYGLLQLDPALMQMGFQVGLAGLLFFVIKNIFEEFVFRGFLTGQFEKTSMAGLPGHVVTGLIYTLWHLAYWSVLLPEGKIVEVSGLDLPLFFVLGGVVLVLQSILLGELRLITGSIWAGVIFHSMSNAFLAGLVAAQAIPNGNFAAFVFSPIDFGLVYSGSMGLIGLFIWRWRTG